MIINIDVSDIVRVPFVTGIQRVVREVVTRLIASESHEIRLLCFDFTTHDYLVIDNELFLEIMRDPSVPIVETERISLDDLGAGDVFYDIDSVWNSGLKRSTLYELLAGHGVFIVTTLYDFVPIKFPEVAHENTIRNWITFISAVYAYANLVMPISRATELDFYELGEQFGVTRHIPSIVTKLGGDISESGPPTDTELASAAPFIGHPFLLFVGTIEPRKLQLQGLQAFDRLAAKNSDLHVVFVGRHGWHSEDTVAAILGHPLFGTRVHWISGASDGLVDLLYTKAFAALYLSKYEGFGLPVAEALTHGTLTIASDNSAIYEAGRDSADYSFLNSPDEIADTLQKYLDDPKLLSNRRRQIRNEFSTYSWDTVCTTISVVFENLADSIAARDTAVADTLPFVYISNDASKVARSIAAHDAASVLPSEYIVVAPAEIADAIRAIPSTRTVRYVDETVVLGDDLADFRDGDDQRRNWLLRGNLPSIDGIGAQFIMLDDDALPLAPITLSTFVGEDGTHNAFFSAELTRWPHSESTYDRVEADTLVMLDSSGYELVTYSAHQPQIIDTALFAEAVTLARAAAPHGRIDEWSAYFDIAITRHPVRFHKRPYETLNWPARATDWRRRYTPPIYTYENYDPSLYSDDLFAGLTVDAEPAHKIEIVDATYATLELSESLFDAARARISRDGLVNGFLGFGSRSGPRLYVAGLPSVVSMAPSSFLRLPISYQLLTDAPVESITFGYRLEGGPEFSVPIPAGAPGHGPLSLPLFSGPDGVYGIRFFATVDGEEWPAFGASSPSFIVSTESAAEADDQIDIAFFVDSVNAPAAVALAAPPRSAERSPKVRLVPIRRATKRLLKWLIPSLVSERQEFHELSGRVSRLNNALPQLQSIPSTLSSTLRAEFIGQSGRTTAEIALLRRDLAEMRIAQAAMQDVVRARSEDSRLEKLHQLAAVAPSGDPIYGITGIQDGGRGFHIARAEQIAHRLGPLRGKRALVTSAGSGYLTLDLQSRGCRTTGWDEDKNNIDLANAVATFVGLPARFGVRGVTLDSLGLIENGSFDLLVLRDEMADLTRDRGAHEAAEYIEELTRRVPIVVANWTADAHKLAGPLRRALSGTVEVSELALSGDGETGSQHPQVIVFQRARVVVVGNNEYPYTSMTAEAYAGSPLVETESRRVYYFGDDMVIKEYQFEGTHSQEFRQIVNEINVLSTVLVDNPVWHVPQLIDFQIEQGEARVVQRRVHGRLLTDLGAIDSEDLLTVTRDLLRTFVDLQALGLSHNDLRSWNILVAADGAWVIDFGLASFHAAEDDIIAIAWALHAAATGDRESYEVNKSTPPPARAFPDGEVRAFAAAVVAGERDATKLLALVGG